jgi:hypothetical protein
MSYRVREIASRRNTSCFLHTAYSSAAEVFVLLCSMLLELITRAPLYTWIAACSFRSMNACQPAFLSRQRSRDHLGSFLYIHQLSDPCTVKSTGRYSAETRGESAGSLHTASAQISTRSSALWNWDQPRDIRRRSRTPSGATCRKYRPRN